MVLSKRLHSIARMVTPGNRLVDVGTDHGYIPIYLMKEGIIPGALAMDINKGPLERADAHINEFGFGDNIQTRLSDGLAKYNTGEGDTILIAGMGGALTVNILTQGYDKLSDIKELILSPQSEIFLVRRFLNKEGFRIVDEKMVLDEGKYYTVIRAVPGDEEHSYNSFEEKYGYLLIKKKDMVLKDYLVRQKCKYTGIIENLKKKNTKIAENRIREITIELEDIKNALDRMEE